MRRAVSSFLLLLSQRQHEGLLPFSRRCCARKNPRVVATLSSLACRPLGSSSDTAEQSVKQSPTWKVQVVQTFPAPTTTTTLLQHLLTHQAFASATQARKAIQYGEIVVAPKPTSMANVDTSAYPLPHSVVPSTPVSNSHQLLRVIRTPHPSYYPMEATRYVFPPTSLHLYDDIDDFVLYETEDFAVVNKPEGMTTIETTQQLKQDRTDLQSLLPFLLTPPARTTTSTKFSNENRKTNGDSYYLPRPVHRLDKGTSGLVLVAKSRAAMQGFSQQFQLHTIGKTYTAIVFGCPLEESGVVDYPIDGKPAVTAWNVTGSSQCHQFSQLECRPRTGRFHQIRRHLAYCLGTPIVGDPKYDLVGTTSADDDIETVGFRQRWRSQGLYLCCHRLELDAADENASNSGDQANARRMTIALDSLPSKFDDILNNTEKL